MSTRHATARPVLAIVAILVGLAATVVVGWASGMPLSDAATLVALAAGGAGAAGAAAAAVLRGRRRSGITFQAVVAGLAPVVAVGIGVTAAASDMFISHHDLHALFVVLVAAGMVGIVAAVLLGRRVAAAGRSLEVLARHLGQDGPAPEDLETLATDARSGSPSELASLATELELSSKRLAAAQHQAETLEASRRELVAWVSHDLRTPLAGIRAMIEALEDGVVDDDATVARYYSNIRREADRLAHLVNDLFELSKIQAGALVLDLVRVPLDEVVSDVVATAAMAARAKGVILETSVATPTPHVELSTPEMNRVVTNLLDNAIRHTPSGGTIRLSATLNAEATAAQVSVRDGCGGIPEHDLDQVFEMAYRGDAARTGGGGGLGLAVARGLVEAHRGSITVRNEDGGCCFVVELPLCIPIEPDRRGTGSAIGHSWLRQD